MSEVVIETRNLTKTFPDGTVAVTDLNLAVPRGAVYGLIGRNGAGKSTALRLLLGLLRPDRGTATILGHDFWHAPRTVRQRVAYVSPSQRLPAHLPLADLCRCLQRFNQFWDQAHAEELMSLWHLPRHRPVSRLSLGEQSRAALLLAFASRPEVLILDEPAAGFDPVARRDLVHQIVDSVTQPYGCTVLLSTHLIGDLERIADHVGILDRGRLALTTPLETLLNHTKRVQAIFETEAEAAQFTIPGAWQSKREGVVLNALVQWAGGGELEMLRASTSARIHTFPVSLEEIFTERFGHDPARPADESGCFHHAHH